jgi:hypothetical protein
LPDDFDHRFEKNEATDFKALSGAGKFVDGIKRGSRITRGILKVFAP